MTASCKQDLEERKQKWHVLLRREDSKLCLWLALPEKGMCKPDMGSSELYLVLRLKGGAQNPSSERKVTCLDRKVSFQSVTQAMRVQLLICPPDLVLKGKRGSSGSHKTPVSLLLTGKHECDSTFGYSQTIRNLQIGTDFTLNLLQSSPGYMLHLSPYWNDIASVQLLSHIACPFYDNKNVTQLLSDRAQL